METEVRDKLTAKEPLDLSFTMEEVQQQVKNASEARKSVQALYNALPEPS